MRRLLYTCGAVLLLVGGTAGAKAVRERVSAWSRAGTIVTDQLLLQPVAREDWPGYGAAYDNRRFSALADLTPANAGKLRVLWRHPAPHAVNPTRKERETSTPVVVDGIIYYTRTYNRAFAVDAATGRELWQFRHYMRRAPLLCCGSHNRGVAVYRDRVYLATLDAHLIALDKQDGHVIWDVEIDDPAQGYSETMAPLAVNGKIIIGAAGAEFGIRGFVDAYDWETGRRLWRFWTIPSPQDGGWWGAWHRQTDAGDVLPRDIPREKADSARFADAWQRGGGSVWMTPAYDSTRNELYVGVGNPAPTVYDANRPGDNLYTCSIVALDLATGRLHWYHQMVPHDMWDTDAGSPPVLAMVREGDSTVPAVLHASKTGWVYVLDRRNGQLIRRSAPFVPIEHPFARPTRRGETHYPTAHGGDPWAPPAYSPETGLLYVLGKHVPTIVKVDPTAPTGAAQVGGQILMAADSQWGTFSAVDPSTGRIRWQRRSRWPLSASGALATAGGLVLFGDGQGYLNIVDAKTGALVSRPHLGGKIGGAPVAFGMDGREYLAVVSTSGLTVLGLP